MSGVLKIVLSLSLSGSLLILLLLLSKPFLKRKTSRRWQYYIWLVVIARLLLPFAPEVSAVGTLFQQAEQIVSQHEAESVPAPGVYANPAPEYAGEPAESTRPSQSSLPADAVLSAGDMGAAAVRHLWLVWLGVALILLIQKITVYQGFVKYIRASCVEVSDVELLDRLAETGAQMGVKRPVELWSNSLISSPLLLGFFHPCIVLPTTELPEADFEYTIRHELTHYKRRDMFYKWLVQLAICVHWFNPLAWRMGREISRACELACDESVIRALDEPGRRAYGDTLLRAMGAGGSCQNSLASVTLNESAELLKERLGAIMQFKKPSKLTGVLSFVLAGALTMTAAAAGAYPGPAKAGGSLWVKKGTHSVQETAKRSAASEAERYYKAESLPLFQIMFSRLDEDAQDKLLDQIYTDDRIAFWGAAVGQLEEDCALIRRYAEKTYADGSVAYFSALTMYMSEDTLEAWLDRALEDETWAFQSILFNALDRGDEFDERKDEQEKEWEEAQKAEYGAVGVTMDGKNYYYQGQLVNVFLDIRPNKSFYTLNVNPMGTVNIKIIRDADNKITGVAYMTEAEVQELLGDI